jgi:hypothetical protein
MTTIVSTDGGPWIVAVREEGPVAALNLLASELLPGVLPFGPGGYAVVPAAVLRDSAAVWLDGAVVPRGREQAVGEASLVDGDLVILRHDPVPGSLGDEEPRRAWAMGILRIRLALSELLLQTSLDYLGHRDVGDTTLLHMQLVKSALAEVLTEHLEIRAVLTGGTDPFPAAVLAHLHRQIGSADHQLLRLLGASGFTAAGAGRTVHASEILADAYCPVEVK